MRSKPAVVLTAVTSLGLAVTGCGSRGSSGEGTEAGTITVGAAVSLTGSVAREGELTKEGYELCQKKVNAAGGVDVGGEKLDLEIKYQDDTSEPDVAAQLVDQFNDDGVKLIL